MMRVFDESLPKRTWDNFHFLEFHNIFQQNEMPHLSFAIDALMEIPDQYKTIKKLGLLHKNELKR
ncbi:unnamed protein product [Soboliphyme baturini]|uniref:Copine domain-containing protein n=1 Tax=Soboliphyme baturini TaxID=241478 RepID=A0A183J0T8_9BILA|nr:unnamed protein product [Soboliphyme baturini]